MKVISAGALDRSQPYATQHRPLPILGSGFCPCCLTEAESRGAWKSLFSGLIFLFLLSLSRSYLLRRQLRMVLGAWYFSWFRWKAYYKVYFAYSRNMTFPIKAHRGNADSCRSGHSSGHFFNWCTKPIFKESISRGEVHPEWNFSFCFQTEAFPHFAEVFDFLERLPLQLLRPVGVRVLSLTQIGHTGGSKASRQP